MWQRCHNGEEKQQGLIFFTGKLLIDFFPLHHPLFFTIYASHSIYSSVGFTLQVSSCLVHSIHSPIYVSPCYITLYVSPCMSVCPEDIVVCGTPHWYQMLNHLLKVIGTSVGIDFSGPLFSPFISNFLVNFFFFSVTTFF